MKPWTPTDSDVEILRIAVDRLQALGVDSACHGQSQAVDVAYADSLARMRRDVVEAHSHDPVLAALLSQLTPRPVAS